MKKLLVK